MFLFVTAESFIVEDVKRLPVNNYSCEAVLALRQIERIPHEHGRDLLPVLAFERRCHGCRDGFQLPSLRSKRILYELARGDVVYEPVEVERSPALVLNGA